MFFPTSNYAASAPLIFHGISKEQNHGNFMGSPWIATDIPWKYQVVFIPRKSTETPWKYRDSVPWKFHGMFTVCKPWNSMWAQTYETSMDEDSVKCKKMNSMEDFHKGGQGSTEAVGMPCAASVEPNDISDIMNCFFVK